jgi:hypothetical protein
MMLLVLLCVSAALGQISVTFQPVIECSVYNGFSNDCCNATNRNDKYFAPAYKFTSPNTTINGNGVVGSFAPQNSTLPVLSGAKGSYNSDWMITFFHFYKEDVCFGVFNNGSDYQMTLTLGCPFLTSDPACAVKYGFSTESESAGNKIKIN